LIMQKSRVLITISISFSIRYIVRTGLLKKMKGFCEPIVAIAWNEQGLIGELKQEGFEVHIIPKPEKAAVYNDTRRKIDIWFDHFCLKSGSKKIQQAYLDQYIPFKSKSWRKAREVYNTGKLYLPFQKKRLFKKEKELLETATNSDEISAFIERLNIDAVFTVTPFHRQEDILLRVCKSKGKKMITSILSFDNITKRGWIPVEYDCYIVWNKENKEQLGRIYPFTKSKPVHVCGPAQFDFYFDRKYLLEKSHWKRSAGIKAGDSRKIILYAGGPKELFPFEPYYLKDIDEAISKGIITDKPIVLFRCHPMDNIERWKKITGNSNNIFFEHSWNGKELAGYANVSITDITKLCSTLAYTDVHINLCSTMTVDGSVFSKPQIGPAYTHDEKYKKKLLVQMYHQEHFRSILNSGVLQLAYSFQELALLINNALANGETDKCKNEKMLNSVISFQDGKSTERVAEVLKDFLTSKNCC
jgi:hypothetical protein